MPLIDNRGGTGGGGGGVTPGDLATAVANTKASWKVFEVAVTGLDIANGYVTLGTQPLNTDVLVEFLEGPNLGAGDVSINQPLSRVVFDPLLLPRILEVFNLYSKLTLKASYYIA